MRNTFNVTMAVLFCLATMTSLAVVAQTSVQCLDNVADKYVGPFNNPLSAAEKTTFYRVKGTPCITCEIDCLAVLETGNPFSSCPCRYIRYGCLASQPCADLKSITPRQWDAAIQLCLAHGCVAKPKILYSNNYDNELYTYSIGQNAWKQMYGTCYNAKKNAEAYQGKLKYYQELNNSGTGAIIDAKSQNATNRGCELRTMSGTFNSTLSLFQAGQATQREVLQAAYQYVNFALDISSPFLMYQFLLLSRSYDFSNTAQRSELMNYANSLLGNIHPDIAARNALFKITDTELNSLVTQISTCGGVNNTRSAAFLDLIDKFVLSLKYRDACMKSNNLAYYVEHYFDAQYKTLTQSLGMPLKKIFDGADKGRNFIYPYLFKTESSDKVRFLDSRAPNGDVIFEFTNAKYQLCPPAISLPPCVRTAIANNVPPLF